MTTHLGGNDHSPRGRWQQVARALQGASPGPQGTTGNRLTSPRAPHPGRTGGGGGLWIPNTWRLSGRTGTSRRQALFLTAGGQASDGTPALQIPVTGTKYHSGGPGAKSCEARCAPGAPASREPRGRGDPRHSGAVVFRSPWRALQEAAMTPCGRRGVQKERKGFFNHFVCLRVYEKMAV